MARDRLAQMRAANGPGDPYMYESRVGGREGLSYYHEQYEQPAAPQHYQSQDALVSSYRTPRKQPRRPRQPSPDRSQQEQSQNEVLPPSRNASNWQKSQESLGTDISGSTLVDDPVEQSEFFDQLTKIKSKIKQLQGLIQRIDSQRSALSNMASTGPRQEELSQDVNRLTDQARKITTSVRAKIKDLEKTNSSAKYSDPQDLQIRKSQIKVVKSKLMETVQQHLQIEQKYRQQSKQRLERQYRIVDPTASDEQVQAAVQDPANSNVFAQAMISSERIGNAKDAYSSVQTRHAELVEIEKNVAELAQLFTDMEVMVDEQGDQVINVEKVANEVETDVNQAEQELGKAVKSAKSARRKRKICAIVFFIILLVIAGVVVYVLYEKNVIKF